MTKTPWHQCGHPTCTPIHLSLPPALLAARLDMEGQGLWDDWEPGTCK